MLVHRSRLLLEQVLEDQGPPALVPRVHKRATLCELPEIDGCETELFGEGRHQRYGAFVVAREKHDPPAAPDVWIGGQGCRGEMIEAFTSRAPGKALATTAEDGRPKRSSQCGLPLLAGYSFRVYKRR